MGGRRPGAKEESGVLMETLAGQWFDTFIETVQRHEMAVPLKEAALEGQLGKWTESLTDVVVSTCEYLGWQASARGYPYYPHPVTREEYLGLDVMAFEKGSEARWRFPVAVFELENQMDDQRVAYSLWKVLCIRDALRVVFCYRRGSSEGVELVRFLHDNVIQSLSIEERMGLRGATMTVVGSRDESSTFPYGFFKAWQLNHNTGTFDRL